MTPSLLNFIFSLVAGATVLILIALAVGIVSSNDRILRE